MKIFIYLSFFILFLILCFSEVYAVGVTVNCGAGKRITFMSPSTYSIAWGTSGLPAGGSGTLLITAAYPIVSSCTGTTMFDNPGTLTYFLDDDHQIIAWTQSFSFLAGLLCAMAFVIAATKNWI